MVLGVSGVLGGPMASLLAVPLVSKHLVSGVSWVVGSLMVAMVTFTAMLPSALQASRRSRPDTFKVPVPKLIIC